jgi:predicted transposase/invertase (TIGR01784 family)
MEANRQFKDSVFTSYFNNKELLLELYNAIEGTNYPKDVEIEINTLENVFYLDKYNDISFVIDDKVVVLVEAQSTINDNMPLRFLMYVSKLYEKMIDPSSMYMRKMIKIPRPEFIVLYNGNEEYPDTKELKLSNAFKEACKDLNIKELLELTVTVYNINDGRNAEILKRSKALNDYAILGDRVRQNLKDGEELGSAITEAINYCIKHGIMAKYLKENSSGVNNMLITEYKFEDHVRVARQEAAADAWMEGIAKGKAEGIAEGIEEGKFDDARNMKADGMDAARISKYTGIPVREIKSL